MLVLIASLFATEINYSLMLYPYTILYANIKNMLLSHYWYCGIDLVVGTPIVVQVNKQTNK